MAHRRKVYLHVYLGDINWLNNELIYYKIRAEGIHADRGFDRSVSRAGAGNL